MHRLYEFSGTECHAKLAAHFGTDILNASDNNRINRKKLGTIVFANEEKLNELNEIVWPALMVKVQNRIEQIRTEKSHDVVMIEAAVLLQAGWQHEMHEVWSLIVPPERVNILPIFFFVYLNFKFFLFCKSCNRQFDV